MNIAIERELSKFCALDEKIRRAWERIADGLQANPSLYPDWIRITADSRDFTNEVELLIARRDDGVVGVFPVHVISSGFYGLPFHSLGLVSNSISYHNNLLSTLDPPRTVKLIVDEASLRNADVVHLAGIPDDTELGTYLAENPQTNDFRVLTLSGESSPYLPLTGSWDELLASKPKKFRYKLRKRAESLASAGNLRMVWFSKLEQYSELFDAIRVIEENSWKKEAGVSIFEKASERRYHEFLLPYLLSKNAMFANVLFRDEIPIAFNLCCVWNGWVGQMKTSFDTRFSELSPGALVIDHAIQHAITLNASEFDFLGDTDQHKLAWTKCVRVHSDHFLYLRSSVKGNLIGFLKCVRRDFFS